jgi:DNA-binding transcriptional regulator YiaG
MKKGGSVEVEELLGRARDVATLPPVQRRREIRERAGASQRDLAAALGRCVMTVNSWERGITNPRGSHAAAYARLLRELEAAGLGDAA